MGESTTSARTLTHRGESLRLSLPHNDYREIECPPRVGALDKWPDSLEIDTALTIAPHTVEIYPDNGHDKDMRVVCAVSDRVQWDQRIRMVRERKLQELGVSAISNKPHNVMIPHGKAGPESNSNINSMSAAWTGLHTPAVSRDTDVMEPTGATSKPSVVTALHGLEAHKVSASLSQQIAALQARHHQISRSVSEIVQNRGVESQSHNRLPSQRELVHQRLSSIAPIVLRKPSRIVTPITVISEEPEITTDVAGVQEGNLDNPGSLSNGLINNNAFKLHQHLASNDMSELIRMQPAQFVPDFDRQYESFQWADEPMSNTNEAYAEDLYYAQAPIPDYQDVFFDQLDGAHQEATPLQGPLYFYPQASPDISCVQHHAAQYNTLYEFVGRHEPQKSIFNTDAEAFIPFAQAIVKPSTESKAIPIVHPDDAETTKETCPMTVAAAVSQASIDKELNAPAQGSFDAYNGFDSGSESESEEDRESQSSSVSGNATNYELVEDNDVRVRSFKFPSPEKPVLTRKRSRILDSESPVSHRALLLTEEIPPPKMSSTPRKSPRIFQKDVALEDTELDSIIMDLSIRGAPAPESSSDEDESDLSLLSEPEVDPERPALRRVASSKLLISHQDADMGLLLDAMLSTKLAVVTDSLSTLQTSVTSITDQIHTLSSSTSDHTARMLKDIREKLHDNSAVTSALAEAHKLREKVNAMESAAAQELLVTSQLRQELWTATSELAAVRLNLDSVKLADPVITKIEDEPMSSQRLKVVDAAKTALQRSVGELTTKASRLEGQLLESMTFCGALQSQYSSAELALAKLRKEINEVQVAKDQAKKECQAAQARLSLFEQHMEEAALQIAEEQSRWHESDMQKDKRIQELSESLMYNKPVTEDNTSRRSSSTSTISEVRMTQFLMDRIKALELSNNHLQQSHREELRLRDDRFDSLMGDWRLMTTQLAANESTVDGLRAELVLSTEFGDRIIEELQRSNNVVDTLSTQLRRGGPVSILKRSMSESEIKDASARERVLQDLRDSNSAKDQRIAELEELLNSPFESTERQILNAVSDNILNVQTVAKESIPESDVVAKVSSGSVQINSTEALQERVKILKRMRMSWEAKAPVLLAKEA
ncbi:protein of unknown function [Taphrina deformans PYCC 5710]|uniref:Uncharacterized protein n=1 Tax=Taphrina deformans (strain PYCC 5710 / ATCC 11124 / CBS 356.35 / IMI 108563 / JCM 9778 / NBRC 8474) TaxID=1097556 RepID=R4XEF4_TAPDE|nr:protein of unknown function [Taphrina deformans PYCC 5710]|eukprot:CCG84141.1 protein of unknown function [Taphrina deformans PYCC 5710]